MAVTSATSTGINVPEIVTGLMDVERAPVKKLEAQIDQKTLVISTLGVFKSKVAALESAAKAIQTPGVFSLRSANSSDATKVSATATNAASAGTYSVKVAQTAQAAALSVSGFTSSTQQVDLTEFTLTFGSQTYTPDGLPDPPTVTDLKDWINGRSSDFTADLVQVATNQYSMVITSNKTGSVNTLSLSGIAAVEGGEEFTVEPLQTARDAFFSVNGLAVQRASNQIDDVVSGVTFSLNSPVAPGVDITDMASATFSSAATTTINITKGAEDLSGAAVQDFVTAYNELISFYKTESISSKDPEARGVLNGDSTLRTFMDRIRGLYANGIRLADGSNISFSSIGVEVQRDGTLFLDKGDLNIAIANGLQDKFSKGVTLGYASSSLSLTSFLTSSLRSTGLVSSHIADVETQQNRLEERVSDWEDKLARIEQRYYRQYAALDALLFRLQTTSNALTSAIESLVNSQKSG